MPEVETQSDALSAPASEVVDLAKKELGEMSARRSNEGFAKLVARRSPQRRRSRLAVSLAAALGIVGLLFFGRHWLGGNPTGPLSYAVEGGRVEASGAIEANGAAEPTLRFSDGTEVVFLEGARGRVRSVDDHGARISLMGKVRVDVVHWRGAQWLFDAGPFIINVKGTAFTAEWREADERLEVILKTGSLAVSGPLSDEAITLRAGQRLVISTREKQVVIRDIDAETESSRVASAGSPPAGDSVQNAAPSASEAPPSEQAAHRPATLPTTPAPSSAPSAPNWPAELVAGHFSIILQEAERRGLEASLAEVSSADLAALADAARYSRREDVARRALTAQRRRFPQSARANDAAFLLGRLEEAAQHPELALGWYERCLAESPRGTYISEALGRKMTVVQRLHGAARARPIAEEYLRRFANGTYAAAARALTRAP